MYTALIVVHATAAAVWLGAMVYSLLVVQPRAARFFAADDEANEAFTIALAAGNRRSVLAAIGVVAASGLALLALDVTGPAGAGIQPVHLAKAGLLIAATVVFWRVSWRIWPRRVFALPDERPALRTALRHAAWTLTVLVGTAFVLAVAAGSR